MAGEMSVADAEQVIKCNGRYLHDIDYDKACDYAD
jgi:hypothetical protein